jgi:hypothetical protein
MPRNRKRKPPAEPVEARAVPLAAPSGIESYESRCGHCGGLVLAFSVNRAPIGELWEPLPLAVGDQFVFSNWGRRWDGTVWRPTADRVRRRQQAREQAAERIDPELSPADRNHATRRRDAARERMRSGAFHRTNHDAGKTNSVGMFPSASRAGHILPTHVQCDCGAVNSVRAQGLS